MGSEQHNATGKGTGVMDQSQRSSLVPEIRGMEDQEIVAEAMSRARGAENLSDADIQKVTEGLQKTNLQRQRLHQFDYQAYSLPVSRVSLFECYTRYHAVAHVRVRF